MRIIWSSASRSRRFFRFWPGVRYLSILPTNHAIDFMVGFIGPFVCGATVVHLRTLRPEFIREAFTRYRITYMTVVPLVLKNLERGLRAAIRRAAARQAPTMLDRSLAPNRALTRRRPHVWLSRLLLRSVHQAFRRRIAGAFLLAALSPSPRRCNFFTTWEFPWETATG